MQGAVRFLEDATPLVARTATRDQPSVHAYDEMRGERRRFGELFFFLVEVGEIVQTGRNGPILGAQSVFASRQGAKREPLGFGKVALGQQRSRPSIVNLGRRCGVL